MSAMFDVMSQWLQLEMRLLVDGSIEGCYVGSNAVTLYRRKCVAKIAYNIKE